MEEPNGTVIPIRVSDKALAHLSTGIYRSPGSALRELVSNAFDADATQISISTGYPLFYQVRIVDDGVGMTRDAFRRHMSGDIGNSHKREQGQGRKTNRPILGRLGIGLLAVAQLCHSFRILSRTEDGQEFEAIVTLEDRVRSRLDANDPSLVASSNSSNKKNEPPVQVGSFVFVEPQSKHIDGTGTAIIIDNLHPSFVLSFKNSLNNEKFEPPSLDWSACVKKMQSVSTVNELGEYWRLLFELAASSPIPYISASSIPQDLVADEQELLESWNFEVVVDSISLRKPVVLVGNKHGYTARSIDKEIVVYGNLLKTSGYIVAQEGLQLKPGEIRGILIRIKGVGIGYYDAGFLSLPDNPGPRSRWITGEVNALAGLEDALNIDRESFNQFHPEFRALQEYVHDELKLMFTDMYREITKRSKSSALERQKTRNQRLRTVIASALSDRVSMTVNTDAPLAKVTYHESGAQVSIADPDSLPIKRSGREVAATVLTLYDVASEEADDLEQHRARFFELLMEYFGH